jgi:hypothetical protein
MYIRRSVGKLRLQTSPSPRYAGRGNVDVFPPLIHRRASNPLKDAHVLDTAVLTAYGFSAKKDLLAQLLALKTRKSPPGLRAANRSSRPAYGRMIPDSTNVVTEDCIRPKSSTTIGP